VVIGFGGTFAYGVLLATAGRTDPRSMPGLLRAIQANDRSLVTIGGVVVLASGIYLAADSETFDEVFVGWGIVAVLVLLGLVHGFFIPTERRAQQAAERDLESSAPGGDVGFGEDFNRANKRMAIVGPIAGIIVVLTIYMMVAKPFL
jgi:hypothetical protein